MATLSPMMQQYLDIKAEHQDHVLFFRLGDFYEMFFEDAINISKELELTLTGRDCGLPERAPMCGIPYHASEGYIKRLIDKGYKVAICEQLENPADTKGLVKRDVVRLVTPGTVIENSLLNEDVNNYIASVVAGKGSFAMCVADISTGEVSLTEQQNKRIDIEIISELSRYMPSEILFNDELLQYKSVCDFIKTKLRCATELFTSDDSNLTRCKGIVEQHFDGKSVDDLNLTDKPLGVVALGVLVNYINATQKDGAQRIVTVRTYNENEYMGIDITAKRNLELTRTMFGDNKRGSLLWVLDKTKTAMGKRYIRAAIEQPLTSLAAITHRQSAVAELVADSVRRDEIGSLLSNVYDLERLMTRVIYGSVNPREVRALGYTIANLPAIKAAASGFSCRYLTELEGDIGTLQDVHALIENAIVDEPPVSLKDGNVIKTGFNAELDEYRNLCGNAKDIIAGIEEKERERSGIKTLKVGYNRVFGYYIEVTKSNIGMVPDEYIRRQTLANCERYITEELKQIEGRVLSASDKILALESEIFNEVRRFVAGHVDVIQRTASAIARLDFVLSLANVAAANNYVCPDITVDGSITIKDGRHPVVEQLLDDTLFVPNDTLLDCKRNRMAIITGPNMAGKSTYMRQVAVIVVMAQIGSFVPASSASIGICDKIFTRVGASDDLSHGQSTFMVEMNEVAHILANATPKSFVILDEIGRGTSTYDGMSIAKAVVSYMVTNKRLMCKTMFATHYHELTALEDELDGVKNYNIAAKKRGEDITFLRKIVPGGADDSYGIEVAKLAGVPQAVVDHAREILAALESEGGVTRVIVEREQEEQLSLSGGINNAVIERLAAISVDTLTPIEALNLLYELKKML